MSARDAIRALAAGDPRGASALLPACRARAFGAEAFGPAAIVELFARNPRPLSPAPAVVEGERTLWICDADLEGREQAWLADLHDGRVARLWRVGDGPPDDAAEPALAFAFDVFLNQDRSPVAFRAEDHPNLAAEAGPALAKVASAAAAGPDPERPAAQGRTFVLRALSAGDRGAALICAQGPGLPPRLGVAAFRFFGPEAVHSRLVWDGERDAPIRTRV